MHTKPSGSITYVFMFFTVFFSFISSVGICESPSRLQGHVPAKAMASAKALGRVPSDTSITMAFALPLRNRQTLEEFIRRVYDPKDPLYGKFLSSKEFMDHYGPTQSDYDAVCAYAVSQGCKITGKHANRALVEVTVTASKVEGAFNVHLNHYKALDGRKFYAPDSEPELNKAMASRISGVIGLSNATVWHRYSSRRPMLKTSNVTSLAIGTGPNYALSPSDIRAAYNLNGIAADGTGQTLAILAMNSYKASDIQAYESYFGLPNMTLQNVVLTGFQSTGDASEETLDIELQIALAPGANRIIVYQTANTDPGVVAAYNRMASDNLAAELSTSWGASEDQTTKSTMNSENTAFMQMAAQGQTIFSASGDNGAYENGTTLSVDDPSAQPYVTATGGTKLFVNSDGSYKSETTWNTGTVKSGASGGGVSTIWAIPTWQSGFNTVASTSMRNVPDVALDADPNTGYAVYLNGAWNIYGGTSCAAPLWAAFTACINQVRTQNGMSLLGFINPILYQIASTSLYNTDFHDISTGNNQYYKALTGYDNATGLGSFNGASLFADLAPIALPVVPLNPSATAGNNVIVLKWDICHGAASYAIYRGTSSGNEAASPVASVSGLTTVVYTDNTAANGTTYYYKIAAANSLGSSPLSSEISATPIPVPDVPTSLTAVQNGSMTVNLTWTAASGASSYMVYRGTSSQGEGTTPIATGITSTTYADSAVSPGIVYYYQISAENTYGTSAHSGETSVTVVAAPENLTASTGKYITLSWKSVTGSSSYNVYRGLSAGSEGTTPYQTVYGQTSYTDTSASAGVTYYYKVTANNGSGSVSPFSDEVNAVLSAVNSNNSGTTNTSGVIEGSSGGGGCFISSLQGW